MIGKEKPAKIEAVRISIDRGDLIIKLLNVSGI